MVSDDCNYSFEIRDVADEISGLLTSLVDPNFLGFQEEVTDGVRFVRTRITEEKKSAIYTVRGVALIHTAIDPIGIVNLASVMYLDTSFSLKRVREIILELSGFPRDVRDVILHSWDKAVLASESSEFEIAHYRFCDDRDEMETGEALFEAMPAELQRDILRTGARALRGVS